MPRWLVFAVFIWLAGFVQVGIPPHSVHPEVFRLLEARGIVKPAPWAGGTGGLGGGSAAPSLPPSALQLILEWESLPPSARMGG